MFLIVIQLEAEVKELKTKVQNQYSSEKGTLELEPTGKVNSLEDDINKKVMNSKTSTDGVKQDKRKKNNDNKDVVEETVEDVNLDIFKCPKCEKVFSKGDNFNYPKAVLKWCSLCTILNYGEQEYGLVQP